MSDSPLAIRLAQAREHHGAGRLADAESLYRGILQEAPQHADALHLLGTLVHLRGDNKAAIDLIRQALAVNGPNAVWLSNLAAVHLAAGELDEAEAQSRQALSLEPSLADAHCNLGLTLLRQGRRDEAETALREALRFKPDYVDCLVRLASILRGTEPVTLLSEAVRLAPSHFQARLALGAALRSLSQPAAAEPHFREAVQLCPDSAAAHVGLGLALRDQARAGEAEICLRDALRLDPQSAEAHTSLGLLLQFQGRADDARAELLAALHFDPNNVWALSGLSRLAAVNCYSFSDEDVERMQALAQSALPVKERSSLHFAVARVYEHRHAYDQAFDHYRRANVLLSDSLPPYDPAQHSRFVDRLIPVLTPAFFERAQNVGVRSDVPVFVVGMPRSGTTLAEQILASHPRVRGAGELHDIGQIVTILVKRLGGPERYPESLDRLDAALARPLAEEYLRRLRQRGGDAVRVVDKMPLNYQHLGVIALLFPQARVVHCRRDPIDTCLSCYFQEFERPLPFGRDLEHLGRHYRDYQRLMAYQARVLPLPIFELDYEELTADQEAVTRRLVDFCGLDWDERCLRFHETERTVTTATALQVRQPLYCTSVGRWQRYQAHLGPLLKAIGID